MPADDLSNIGAGMPTPQTPTGKSAAALEEDLQAANRTIAKQKAERLVFLIVLVIIWDAHTFKSFSSWAPTISLLVLELIGFFVLAYRFDLHEVVKLFWGVIRTYGRQDPGDEPTED